MLSLTFLFVTAGDLYMRGGEVSTNLRDILEFWFSWTLNFFWFSMITDWVKFWRSLSILFALLLETELTAHEGIGVGIGEALDWMAKVPLWLVICYVEATDKCWWPWTFFSQVLFLFFLNGIKVIMLCGLWDWFLFYCMSDFYECSLWILKIYFSCFTWVILFLKLCNERVLMSACFERCGLLAPSRASKLFTFPFYFRAIEFFYSSIYFGACRTFWADKNLDLAGNNCFLFKSLTVRKLDA